MAISSVFSSLLSPGVYVRETTDGARVLPLQSHVHIYVFGSAASGTNETPTQVINPTDFTNQFGASPSTNSIKLIFENDPTAVVYFIKTSGTLAADYVSAIQNALDVSEDWPAGFLIAPEAFQGLALESDRVSVGTALENLAATQDHMALIDAGDGLTTPSAAETELIQYTTAKGHAAVFWPYVIDLNDNEVPASPAVAAVHTRRFKEEGLKPGAGAKYPVLGVKDVVTRVNTQQQDTLNPDGINVIRYLRNKGVVVWGMRTRQVDELLYRFIHYRVIQNVINRTFEQGVLDRELFDLIDGEGVLLSRLQERGNSVGRQLYQGGLLFGATEEDAFEVVCDFRNNTTEQLQQGNVLLEFFASIAPGLEKLLINTVPVGIGNVPDSADRAEQIS